MGESDVGSKLSQKANISSLAAIQESLQKDVDQKADKTSLEKLNSMIVLMADKTDMAAIQNRFSETMKTLESDVDNKLGQKASISSLAAIQDSFNKNVDQDNTKFAALRGTLHDVDNKVNQKADKLQSHINKLE